MLDSEVWKDQIQTKKLNKAVVKGLYDDLREDPRSFKFDILWVLDGTTMFDSLWHLLGLPTLKQHVDEVFVELDAEPTIQELVDRLVAKEISGPIFREFIHDKNGITPEVSCLRVEHLEDAVEEVKERPLTN